VDATEEDFLFEYLSMLAARPEIRLQLGERAQRWVERECNWTSVAERYVAFLKAVAEGREYAVAAVQAVKGDAVFAAEAQDSEAALEDTLAPAIEPDYIRSWAAEAGAKTYVDQHLARLTKTLEITPPGRSCDRILEMGSYLQITPALRTRLGYGEVRACYYGELGRVDRRRAESICGEEFECDIELFDAEKDSFPYEDEYFSTVLCCELIEHLFTDPMHMMSEINRILKPGGHFVLTTPNIGSIRALSAILQGYHPGFFPAYIRRSESGNVDARHNREYTPKEIQLLLHASGVETVSLETGEFHEEARPEHEWVRHLLEKYKLPRDLRGDGIYAVGRKTGPIRERYPGWLYN
jgi:SAM-dependent methyltransferase